MLPCTGFGYKRAQGSSITVTDAISPFRQSSTSRCSALLELSVVIRLGTSTRKVPPGWGDWISPERTKIKHSVSKCTSVRASNQRWAIPWRKRQVDCNPSSIIYLWMLISYHTITYVYYLWPTVQISLLLVARQNS